ncbi:MAG: ATP-binding protein [Caldilineales bacterium]|nr:ATP-binding protein [Caldilineales bacterium]MCW5860358.1 AAA family ATPase [Caldilineales bacterium]
MIKRIEALNYRSLRYVAQELRDFQVLVGPNASGKSTFLDVVALLGDFVRFGVDDALLFGLNPERGRARSLDELIFNQIGDRFELAIELAVPDALRPVKRNGGGDFLPDAARYEVAFGKAESGQVEIQAEALWLIDSQRAAATPRRQGRVQQLDLFPAEPSPPASIISSGKTPAGWQTVVKKSPHSGNDYFKAEGGKWNIQYRVGARKAALAGLPDDASRFPIAIWVRNLLLEGVRVLALNSAAMRRPVSPSALRRFSVEGANLPLVVQDLERHHPDVHRDWVAHVQTILPDLAAIQVHERPDDRHLYLALKYASSVDPVPSWLASDGTLRLLTLTLLAYLPDSSGVYLIEEPENGIHPRAIAGVFQSLSSVYSGQVLVATHSALFLGLAEPAQLLCFARNPSGAISIISGDNHPSLKTWRGEVDLSTLYAAGVLG